MSLSTTQVENTTVDYGCNPQNGRTGLLGSGASHVSRAGTDDEVNNAERLTVQLANGSEVTLAQNKGGTLLSAPPREGDDVSPVSLWDRWSKTWSATYSGPGDEVWRHGIPSWGLSGRRVGSCRGLCT